MDLARPARDVVPSLAADVLVALAGSTQAMTGRQVHAVAGAGSQKGVSLVLRHLARSGLVNTQPAGSAVLYLLNRDHVAADAALALVDLRGKLFARITSRLQQWPVAPVAAAVFGSAARGDGGHGSDVDLFLVRPPGIVEDDPAWSAEVSALREDVPRWCGNPCSIVQADPTQVAAMVRRDAPVVHELRRDLVPLYGPDVLSVAP